MMRRITFWWVDSYLFSYQAGCNQGCCHSSADSSCESRREAQEGKSTWGWQQLCWQFGTGLLGPSTQQCPAASGVAGVAGVAGCD
jgi:hypothetical protein